MKDKAVIDEELRTQFGELLDTLETAVNEAEVILTTARLNGRTGTQYLHLLRALATLSVRAYSLDAKLGDKT